MSLKEGPNEVYNNDDIYKNCACVITISQISDGGRISMTNKRKGL